MKIIPTKIHGMLDYITAGALFILPTVLDWDDRVKTRVRVAAVGTLLYSLVTRYEWGLTPVKVLPMAGHLACDGASGALFCAAPMLLPDQPARVKNTLVGIGLFELLVTLMTQTQPADEGL